ncbi:MAG: NAD(+)/NADH kinase [Coriobacteriia bacterium]|nr:NAD(+)/NADH kinase [Coriobacteriia bacterium]
MRYWEADVRILLVPNPANPRSVAATRQVSARLTALGYEPFLDAEDAEACDLVGHGVPRSEIGEPELSIALGGDGTILKAVHLLGVSEVPVLGVNLGRLGFLSGAGGDRLDDVLDAALAGEPRVERRQTIEGIVRLGGRDAGSYRALNEVFVGRGGGARGVELEVAVNETPVGRWVCDGLVVATPTGSTAYALSAGGPIVSPDVRGMVIVPVAPHTLGVRPLVTGPGDIIRVSCPNPARADACVTVDGDQVPCRTALDSVEIRVGDHDVRLMRLDGQDFYATLSRAFLGG